MASSGRKMVIHESEKSQKVQMFNWVEDARHKKSLRSLSRSEKTVVGKITVDQKLLYKRYSNRLHHSRITFARITENRQLEKELVSKVHLNTEVGMEGEQDVMLQRIWSSGSQKMEQIRRQRNSRRSRQYESQFKLRIRSLKEDEDERDEALEEACISRPTTARSLRSLRSPHRPVQKPRPHTAIDRLNPQSADTGGGEVAKEGDEQEIIQKREVTISTPIIKVVIENEHGDCIQGEPEAVQAVVTELENCGISDKEGFDQKPSTGPSPVFKVSEITDKKLDVKDKRTEGDQNISEQNNLHLAVTQKDNKNITSEIPSEGILITGQEGISEDVGKVEDTPEDRTKTVEGAISPFFSHSPRNGSRPHSRRVSISNRPSHHNNHVKIGSLFPEDTKPSLLELQKVQVQLANYKGRIKKFGDSLGDMRVKENADNSVDYYNIRLRSSTEAELQRKRQTLRKTYEDLITTTEGEYRRWKGNMDIRSMTTRNVDWDFNNRRSSYIDVSMY